MKIALVGGAGFIGGHLASALQEQGISFEIFDKTLSGKSHIDITKKETLAKLKGFTTIVNLAAEHRDDVRPKSRYDAVNIAGSENICDFCSENDIFNIIFISSVAVYGFAPPDTDESGNISYFNDYGRTKFLAEEVYRRWHLTRTDAKSLIIIRPTVVFGEGNRGNVYNLFSQIVNKKFLMIGQGNNVKSMAYVKNVAAFLTYCLQLKGYHLFNYVDKPDFEMNSLVCFARERLCRKNGVGVRLPGWLASLVGGSFDLLATVTNTPLPVSRVRIKKFMSDSSFTSSVNGTDFTPPFTLLEGLENTIASDFQQQTYARK